MVLAVALPMKIFAHPDAVEQMVDWTAATISRADTGGDDPYACGVMIVVNPKLAAVMSSNSMPQGMIEETMEVLHERAHTALLNLLGDPRS